VLTQLLQEPITESAQDNNKCTKVCLCIITFSWGESFYEGNSILKKPKIYVKIIQFSSILIIIIIIIIIYIKYITTIINNDNNNNNN
jgi:hypothetical protein